MYMQNWIIKKFDYFDYIMMVNEWVISLRATLLYTDKYMISVTSGLLLDILIMNIYFFVMKAN